MENLANSNSKSVEYDNLFIWVKKRLEILGYHEAMWSISSTQAIVDFISGEGNKTLSVTELNPKDSTKNSSNEYKIQIKCDLEEFSAPPIGTNAYFLRVVPDNLTTGNIDKCIQYGTIGGSGLSLESLERIMKGLVEKQISQNNELSSHYHRCMATLTDTIHYKDGRTVLYCPNFEFSSVSEASNDKDRLQIMESVVIHWTRQIKDVVNNHENSSTNETSGPLDEIEFWKVRAQDLLGIRKQLEVESVTKIISVLEYAKSNYIQPFKNRTEDILTKAAEANDNLKFLETIREQCTALRLIDAEKINTILPDLLHRIRLIWSYSSYYSNNDHIAARLLEAIECGIQWKQYYQMTSQAIINRNLTIQSSNKNIVTKNWKNIDNASIFAQIDAFVQRCRDLIDICESQIQFSRKSSKTKGQPGPLPKFGGTKSQEIIDGILGIQVSFESRIEKLKKLDYDILDVRISKWHDDYYVFKNGIKDLEVMYTNVINVAYENNSTIQEGVYYTLAFNSLAKRDVIKRCVEKKAAEILRMFLKQIQTTRSEFEKSRLAPPLRYHEPQYAGSALWANSLACLDNLYDEFIVTLADADKILDRSKITMKRELEVQMEAYGNSMIELKSNALIELPYNNENKSIEEALNIIESYKQKIIKAKEKETVLSNGLSIFKIVSTEHKDLTYINKDIENLTAIWNVLIEFNNHWDNWKTNSFNTLDIIEMESILLNFNKKINKLGRDIKKWKIWEHMKAEIDKLKEILPLIQDLRNKALRPRHWNALQDKIDFIGELSSNANKELAIEVALAELEEHWSTIVVEIGVYKDKYYKIKSTDALIQFLEDDSVALSSMKSSKFYSSFSYYIDDWEKTLGTISEVIDLLLNVQRKWIYLESIFLSGGDISKQLPQEYTLFVGVNNDFLSIMNIFEINPIAKQSCLTQGIKSLKMIPPNTVIPVVNQTNTAIGNNANNTVTTKTFEASHMIAPDGEIVQFVDNVTIDGAVELWLIAVERAMKRAIGYLLYNSVYKEFKSKKDKWIKDTIGQLLITTGSSMNSNNVISNNITNPSNNPSVNNPPNMGNNSSITYQPLNISNNEFGKCVVSQLSSTLEYSNEYQGNNGRLVVTPLTDRCVLTLITAMYLNRGGNPLGPAGTGKTETVKDLGKNLAKYVVVINCSDGMDYKSVGRIFSGLVQSVFSFSFMGSTIPCNSNTGIFITMNPGYAGRTELPDNLKALMRPVAMMAPDLSMIAEVILASEGFNEARIMAKKTVTLYSLMIQQLSKQDHYDYGLRNLKAVLNMAGQLKRLDITTPEETILMRALRDMNLPKFIKDDERLFRLLLGDPYGGKSTVWKTLANATTSLAKQGVEGYNAVVTYVISPKSIELDELYGAYDLSTCLDEISRKKISVYMADIDAIGPVTNTLYDYYVDISKNDFIGWDTKVPNWRPLKNMTFHDMIVPTVDTIRNQYIVDTYLHAKKHTMVVGSTGTDSQIVRIFESILSSKFIEYENEIKQLSSGITIATLSVYKAVCIEFLATPEKFHYLFNLRDVAKVIQGILMGSRKSIYTPEGMLRLWIHECQRVFSDRFISSKSNDENKFRELLAMKISENLQKDWNSIISDSLDPKIGPLFCGFVHDNVGNVNDEDYTIIYEEITDYKKIRSIIEERLDDYNNEPKLIPMNLAMFRDAVMHHKV
eukprot:gene17108-22622_t